MVANQNLSLKGQEEKASSAVADQMQHLKQVNSDFE
jgi:hypothetical protein